MYWWGAGKSWRTLYLGLFDNRSGLFITYVLDINVTAGARCSMGAGSIGAINEDSKLRRGEERGERSSGGLWLAKS